MITPMSGSLANLFSFEGPKAGKREFKPKRALKSSVLRGKYRKFILILRVFICEAKKVK
jgi:hypothetical protein